MSARACIVCYGYYISEIHNHKNKKNKCIHNNINWIYCKDCEKELTDIGIKCKMIHKEINIQKNIILNNQDSNKEKLNKEIKVTIRLNDNEYQKLLSIKSNNENISKTIRKLINER